MSMNEKIKFKRKFAKRGDSSGIFLPPELITFLELQNNDEVTITGETGKHGKYLSVWKEKQVEENETIC